MRTPLSALLATELPDPATAGAGIRFVYATLFLAQVALAVTVGAAVGSIAPRAAQPHDLVAGVLVVMAAAHLPFGLVLAWAVSRPPGKGSALAGALTAAVVLSVPAWFAVLLSITAQRTPYVWIAWSLLAAGYLGGMGLSPRWVRGATTPPPAEGDAA
jgi:hypothetical protein